MNVYDDFVERYKLLERDLDDAYGCLNHTEEKIKELETDKQDCKAKILDSCEMIVELNEELQTARGMCRSLRASECIASPLNTPYLTSRTQKENIPVLNLPSIEDDACAHRQKLYNFLNNTEEELEDEVLRLRDEV